MVTITKLDQRRDGCYLKRWLREVCSFETAEIQVFQIPEEGVKKEVRRMKKRDENTGEERRGKKCV